MGDPQGPAPCLGRLRSEEAAKAAAAAAAAKKKVTTFQVAIDFGTTNTAVAFTNSNLKADKIYPLDGFPGERIPTRTGTQVPSEIWYLPIRPGQTNERRLSDASIDPSKVLYGYEIGRACDLPFHLSDEPTRTTYQEAAKTHVRHPKLLLDDSKHLDCMRDDLKTVMLELKRNDYLYCEAVDDEDNNIVKDLDARVIVDFLTCVFRCVKGNLRLSNNLEDDSKVEVTFTVPVCWSPRSNARMMACVESALRYARFGIDEADMCSLFMVNEAEAAAAYVLHESGGQLTVGETFILLDVGGGTTDIGTFKIAQEMPLRLGDEVIKPTGAVCGSQDVNMRFREFVLAQLRGETYLEDRGQTIDIVDIFIMNQFECEIKRRFSLTDTTEVYYIHFYPLRSSQSKPLLRNGAIKIPSSEMFKIFKPSFDTVEYLLQTQIAEARNAAIQVDKVVCVGGFCDNPAMRDHIQNVVDNVNSNNPESYIKVFYAPLSTSATSVAMGAVLRSLNKANGPRRLPRLSIGIKRHIEQGDPDRPTDDADWRTSEYDGKTYKFDVIEWKIKAGKHGAKSVHRFKYESLHYFRRGETEWIAPEGLFVCETAKEDFHTLNHPANAGAVFLGNVEFDVTHLEGRVPPEQEGPGVEYCYAVLLTIEMILIDRNIEVKAYWENEDGEEEEIQGSRNFFSVVSAFDAGAAA